VARLLPDTIGLTVLLALLTSLGPLSTDLYLPSLPSIAGYFSATNGHAQLTLSAYLVGYALGLPIYGPLSDRRGRKSVLMAGLVIYGLANVISALAPSLDMLIASRFLQGFGAAGPIVLARAVVRDLFDGRRAGQQLARMGAIMGVVPAIAPILGVGLDMAFGWRGNFWGVALLAAGIAFVTITRLPETLRERAQTPINARNVLGGYGGLLKDKRFLPFGLLATATYSGLFAFLSGSSFIYQTQFGVSPLAFAVTFATIVGGFISGSFLSNKLTMRFDQRKLILVGSILQAGAGAAMLAGVVTFPGVPLVITVTMAVYLSGVGFTLPQSMARAMMPFPEKAGAVSSLIGILQIGTAAFVGAGVGAYIDRGPIILAGTVAFFGLMALAIQPFISRN
jgi:MFS transporter, DHA1 family, multidrug resistance protein